MNIATIVFGNILAFTPFDSLQLAIIGMFTLVCPLIFWKDFMVVFFDDTHAHSIGPKTTRLKILFFTLLSASTVAALQTLSLWQ